MTDGLRIAHLRIAPQWAILRWAILTFTGAILIKRVWLTNSKRPAPVSASAAETRALSKFG